MGTNTEPASSSEVEDPFSGLSETFAQLIRSQFPRNQWREAAAMLLAGCGPTFPMPENSPTELERVRIAVLELSKGNLARLRHYISEARLDWRDVLMWAGSHKPGG